MRRALVRGWAFSLVVALLGCGAGPSRREVLLPLSEQIRVREGWLATRHGLLLDMMRRHGVAMWVVATEEFHPDPLAELVTPPRPYVGNRDFFVFIDAGERGLRRVAVTAFAEESLTRFFESPAEPRPAKDVLLELYREHDPHTIALSIGGRRGVTHSLTHDAFLFLRETLGPQAEARFVSAEGLIEEYLDTRLPDELDPYTALVSLTESLAQRAFSSEVVTPGRTTVGDVRRWLMDQAWGHGLDLWFQPDLRVQRRGAEGPKSRGFLAVASEDTVIRRGDLLHVDFGMNYMGLASDWQRMAYVLRDGEDDAPAGLRRALAATNALQESFCQAARPGKDAGEVYREVMAEMARRGIQAQVYSHPLGNQGHGLGPGIDFRSAERGETGGPPRLLRPGSYLAMELNTRSQVAEWDGQEVFIMEEDPVHLTDAGYRTFRPRQESLYLIR